MITKRVSTQKITLGGKYGKIVNAGFCVSQRGCLGQMLQKDETCRLSCNNQSNAQYINIKFVCKT
jgi:hypothetical protein